MGSRLYVGNLSWNTTEDALRSAFEQGGRTVKTCQIISDRETGRPRGFAFVEMASDSEAQAATAALNGTQLDGRQIQVNEARERTDRPRGGGGGGFGGGGGGGGGRGGGGGGWGGGGGGGGGRDRGGDRGGWGGGGGRDRGDRGGDRW